MTSKRSNADWVASLSPWPADGFGLERMRALLAALGDPQRRFPAVHVVGTNGKSTATRAVAGLLRAGGLDAGAYTSPHVSGWGERLDTDDSGFERAVARVRDAAERLGATQFETLTAAAYADFAARRVDVAVVEAGLGGRLDATNTLADTRVVLLTNVELEHTDVLGDTREAIAREKLAVARPESVVVLPDPEFRELVRDNDVRLGGAREAAAAFLGHEAPAAGEPRLPGRLERRGTEVRDGAHNPAGARWLAERLAGGRYTLVVSVLADKDVDAMLGELASLGDTLVATRSANVRALEAGELAARATRHFARVEVEPDPVGALARARALGDPVLVTGSLYLLADLAAQERMER